MQMKNKFCTGCGACAARCPLNCITMKDNSEGFRYPIIDASLCIDCYMCEKVCSVHNKLLTEVESTAYGVKHKDEYIRRDSSSGGAFPALAFFVLSNGGAVCGAAYAEDFSVEHQIIEDMDEIGRLQGSKYSQSRVEHLFFHIQNILDDGRLFLFVGTPCQVAGLRAYLDKDYENLILVDMICHGVPSPFVWKKYLEYRRKKDARNKKIIHINQRDKVSGWSRYRYSMRIDYENKASYCVLQSDDPYMRGFVNNLFLRPSCAQCCYKGSVRCSDITLGDYWGVWEQNLEFDDDKGTSLVLIHTEKGVKLWELMSPDLEVFSVNIEEALASNPSALKSSKPHPKRKEFFERYENDDFDKLVSELLFGMTKNKYFAQNLLRKLIKI